MYEAKQRAVCEKYGVAFTPPEPTQIVGLARNVRSGDWPVHALRHPVEHGTSGWYIWAIHNEIPDDSSFFEPVHLEHLPEIVPSVIPYMALPPGWRFLLAPQYEDVWFDPQLLILA